MKSDPRRDDHPSAATRERESDDDAADIRYSLTALGETALAEAQTRGRGNRFRGFGPCAAVA